MGSTSKGRGERGDRRGEVARGPQGRPKVYPATQNASQKSLGTKIRKLGDKVCLLPFCFKGKISALYRLQKCLENRIKEVGGNTVFLGHSTPTSISVE